MTSLTFSTILTTVLLLLFVRSSVPANYEYVPSTTSSKK